MLLVRAKIAPSKIHGLGLFAAEAVKQGTPIWRFQPDYDREFDAEQLKRLPQPVQEWLKQYAYLDFHLGTYVLCFDDARFINHSESPTIRPDYKNDRYGTDIAVRDIEIEDEITTDYRLFDQGILDGHI